MSAAREHLAAIARAPRPAGGEAERVAREYCAGVLRAAGLEVSEHPFGYSTFPGRWGTPLFGACVATLLLLAARAGASGSGVRALATLVLGTALLAAFGHWLARSGILDLPFARARSTNLVATRGIPNLWLVAHLDSKSQPIPIGVRALAIIASLIILGVAMGVGVAELVVPIPPLAWYVLATMGFVVALPVMASIVGARSDGALDNASGVASVLRAAELTPAHLPIGVLLTSAEELGLAGARAWARSAPRGRAFNVDGVDDVGRVRAIYSRKLPAAIIEVLIQAKGFPAPERLPPGLLMDGIALADAGWEVLNLSKGEWSTVSRIHTPADDVSRLQGVGVEEVATMLARALVAQERFIWESLA